MLHSSVLSCPMTRTDKASEVLHKVLLALIQLCTGEIPTALSPQMLVDSVWQSSFQMIYIPALNVIPALKSERAGMQRYSVLMASGGDLLCPVTAGQLGDLSTSDDQKCLGFVCLCQE